MIRTTAWCHERTSGCNTYVACSLQVRHTGIVTDAAVAPELIDAVEQVLTAYGWNGTTAELIAEAAGINRVTLYRRGLTKERLLAAAALAAGC